MTIRRTEAIVLRTRDFSETSLIVSFYTRELGKINGLAKGIKTRRKKYNGYLQPFTYNDIVFYEKVHGGLCAISQCDLRDFFPAIREDLQKIANTLSGLPWGLWLAPHSDVAQLADAGADCAVFTLESRATAISAAGNMLRP